MEDDDGPAAPRELRPPWDPQGTDGGRRVLALSDEVLAFAMVLLVLGLVLPGGTTGAAIHACLGSRALDGRPGGAIHRSKLGPGGKGRRRGAR